MILKNKLLWILGTVGILLLLLAMLAGPSVVNRLWGAIWLNPNNFADANTEFFQNLSHNKVNIYRFSPADNVQVEQGDFQINIVSIERDLDKYADQDNKKAHANDAVIVFACYQTLYDDRELGRKLLRLLKEHDPTITYNYPTGKKSFGGGYEGANIYIDDLIDAADKMIKGDQSQRDLLEQPASQYEWRTKEYAPSTF